MNINFLTTFLLLLGNYYAKAEIQELLPDTRAYLPPLIYKHINCYLPPAKTHHQHKAIKTSTPDYIHNKPKAIDDPLPAEADYIEPLDIDFKNDKHKPNIKGAVASYAKPLFRAKPADELSAGHVVIIEQDENVPTTFKILDHNIEAESSIASKTYAKNPAEADVVPINSFHDPATKYKLFNHDTDDTGLSGSAPEVIFKPGDDIEFLKDTSVIDDYEHSFSEENLSKTKQSKS